MRLHGVAGVAADDAILWRAGVVLGQTPKRPMPRQAYTWVSRSLSCHIFWFQLGLDNI